MNRSEIIPVSRAMDFWWPRLSSLGGGFWVATIGAVIVGFLLARTLLRPGPEARGSREAQQISLWRTVAGFGFVLGVSWSYRSPEDTLDNTWGTFNMTIGVATVVALVSLGLLWVSSRGDDHGEFRPRASQVLSRMGGAALGFAAMGGIGYLIVHTDDYTPRPVLVALFGASFGVVVFYGAACWYISRFWFGLNAVHALLGSFVTAVTICVMTAYTLIKEGPNSLPVPSWLMITFCGLVTTLGICAWDFIEQRRPGTRGPAVAVATVVMVLLGAGGVVIGGGTAQQLLCYGRTPVNCEPSDDDQPSRIVAQAMEFRLPTGSGLELNASRPTPTQDPVAADLVFNGAVYAGQRSAVVVWTGLGEPGRDRCDRLLMEQFRPDTGYRPVSGMWLCVGTSQGRLAGIRVTAVAGGSLVGSATLWL